MGTTLGSWTVAIPRLLWRLPWHHGTFTIDCAEDATGRYTRYRMTTTSAWAPAELELVHTPGGAIHLPGFDDIDQAITVLTHPLAGYYYRRDGRLGSYRVWHERLTPDPGTVQYARVGLLDRLGLVPFSEQANAHSVLIQPRTEFLVQLPPRAID